MVNLSETHRIAAAGALVILGFIIIISGTVRIGNLFREPFDLPLAEQPDETSDEDRVRSELSAKDTDGDGLNDYEELNVYNTSPYLSDSDSDGTNDAVEIAEGQDPNCPKGQNCYGAVLELETETPIQLVPGSENQNISGQQNFPSIPGLFPEDPEPEDIRNLLRESGYEEEVISQFTDEDLIDVYKQTLNAFEN